MAVHFIEEDRKAYGFNRTVVKKWLDEVVKLEGKKTGKINYVFCSDDYLVGVNMEFLKRDYFTDVISFDYSIKNEVSGDILISVDRVGENAKNIGVSDIEELKRIMVHGLLHLIGYDDGTDETKAIMSAREDLYLGLSQ
jgi:rRNA maturation RNase YbeY